MTNRYTRALGPFGADRGVPGLEARVSLHFPKQVFVEIATQAVEHRPEFVSVGVGQLSPMKLWQWPPIYSGLPRPIWSGPTVEAKGGVVTRRIRRKG